MLWSFAMSLDGYVAGPAHSMDFLGGATVEDGYIAGAIEALAPCCPDGTATTAP